MTSSLVSAVLGRSLGSPDRRVPFAGPYWDLWPYLRRATPCLVVSVGSDFREGDAWHDSSRRCAAVHLYWIPLGAGTHVVRVSGKVFEAVSALAQGRRPCNLYHSALEVIVPEGRFVIEMTPIPDVHGERRGVVAEGGVGTKWAGRFRLFRYEIRRWREGVIPDASQAISSPVSVCHDLAHAQRILELVASVPTPVWGRDELVAGEMWSSNSVTSWLLRRGGVDTEQIQPPRGGRAPGWDAGLVVAARDLDRAECHRTDNHAVANARQ